jgi:DNA-3-methyladenine glycosylase
MRMRPSAPEGVPRPATGLGAGLRVPLGSGLRLPRAFFDRPTLQVARDLLGCVLVHETRAGRTAGLIVEVEAYIGEDDPACHAARGLTPRNRMLYAPPGHAYVYLNYGLHCLLNVVTEREGFPAAVLLRALDPLEGVALMRRRRRLSAHGAADPHGLCRGPGRLARALGITLRDNGCDLCAPDSRLWIEWRGVDPGPLRWTRRIGITRGRDRWWRAYVAASPAVSGRRHPSLPAPRPVPTGSG